MEASSTNTMGDAPAGRLGRRAWAIALFAVTILAMAMRWYYLTHAMVYQPIRGDATQYHAYAWNLVHHGLFSKAAPNSAQVVSDSYRDPGYPVFMALSMKLAGGFKAWYPLTLLTQGLLGALTVMLLMIGARGWLADRWLIGSGVLMALWPHSVTITSFLLSETLFGFLCALAFCLLRHTIHRRSKAYAATAGLVFAMASLTNAILLPFAPLLAGFLLFRRHLPRSVAVTLAVAALALPTAWSIRNLQLPSGASSSGRALLNLDQGSWPDYHAGYILYAEGHSEGRKIMHAISQESDVLIAHPAAGLLLMGHRMMQSPMHYLGWYLSKPALLWGWSIRMGQGDIYVYPTANSPFSEVLPMRVWVSVCHSINPLLMLLGLAGCVLSLRRACARPIAESAAVLGLYVTVLYSLLQAEPRYSIPFRGFECLLAAYAAQRLMAWIAVRRRVSAMEQAKSATG